MQDFGGLESSSPGEGQSGGIEELSEDAKQRFAAAAKAGKALQQEERRSKKRDQKIAKAIIRFLNDDRFTHLFVLISRLVGRDCPSIFLLAILSLIDDEAAKLVEDFLRDGAKESAEETPAAIIDHSALSASANAMLSAWMGRVQGVLQREHIPILMSLLLDERNVDGTILQLTTFVLQTFFQSDQGGKKKIAFEKIQPLTASILTTLFQPYIAAAIQRRKLTAAVQGIEEEDNE